MEAKLQPRPGFKRLSQIVKGDRDDHIFPEDEQTRQILRAVTQYYGYRWKIWRQPSAGLWDMMLETGKLKVAFHALREGEDLEQLKVDIKHYSDLEDPSLMSRSIGSYIVWIEDGQLIQYHNRSEKVTN